MKSAFLSSLLLLALSLTAQASEQYVLKIDGMTCKYCAHNVKKTLQKLDGVESVKVDQDKGLASLQVKPGTQLSDDKLRKIIADTGFNYRGMQTKGSN